jgi:hypothetical protein
VSGRLKLKVRKNDRAENVKKPVLAILAIKQGHKILIDRRLQPKLSLMHWKIIAIVCLFFIKWKFISIVCLFFIKWNWQSHQPIGI